MKKILWVSRHEPLKSQIDELKRIFGEIHLIVDKKPFISAKTIVDNFNAISADEMVLVAPLTVCKAITDYGIRPLYAEMRRTDPENSEIKASGRREQISGEDRYYRFVRFQRLLGIDIRLVDV